jgi:uncharacterized protein DUF5916
MRIHTPAFTSLVALLLCALSVDAVGAQASGNEHGTRPVVRAELRTDGIAVDGRLSEDVWQKAGAATDFRQQDPREGEPASQRTEVRFVYDADALYIGARMFDDKGAAGVRARLARRDQVGEEGDFLQFVIDTFHDHTGRTIFTISPSGARGDAGQAAPFTDPSWDPIWDVATQIDSLGWSAEMRIPFSQLRFPAGQNKTWGVQIWRYVERLAEMQMWSYWGKQDAGGPAYFGHLEGLSVESRKLGLEVMPYLATRAEDVTLANPDTPLREPREFGLRGGADLKALLSSTLTLDATFNPDFGQVEVDPAVVNLSAFETSFEEKRPFFVEGSGLFGFGGFNCMFCSNVSSLSLFYSRRIGRRPQGTVSGNPRFVEVPDNSTILGAAKVTGRTRNGYQIGVLNALTSAEQARAAVSQTAAPFEEEVEPLTNFLIGRVKKNYNDGNLTLGAIATSVVRRFENDSLRTVMPAHSEAVGTDFNINFKQRRYNIMGNVAFSQVTGDPAVMLRLQRSSARYFHRPDREAGSNGLLTDRFDENLTEMRGAGAYVRAAKVTGSWQWESALNVRTPGFEANDMAFLTRADYAWMNANLYRGWTKPTNWYRQIQMIVGGQQQYNFDGDLTDRQFQYWAWMQWPNYWTTSGFTIWRPQVDDDRMTRGGAVVRRPGASFTNVSLNTDNRKRLVLSANTEYGSTEEGAFNYGIYLDARYKPAPNLSISFGPGFSRSGSNAQYVNSFTDATASNFYGRRTVFAGLVQHNLSFNTRVSATFTPALTLELFAQPFVSTGEYDEFKEFTRPRTLEKRRFDSQQLQEVSEPGNVVSYQLDPDRNPLTPNFEFENPDFNFRSLRGNAVLRWEYRPGSTLFLVWQQQRSEEKPYGDFDFSRDSGAIFDGRPDNIFLVKMTYWLGR